MNRSPDRVEGVVLHTRNDTRRSGIWRLDPAAVAGLLALALAAPSAAQNVSSTGDVSPPFTPAPVVDLTGQRIFIGNTSGGVGGIGTVNVTAGGILTAAQVLTGLGGLGTGFVNVTGAGSTLRLTGGASFNGLDVGWRSTAAR